MRLPNILALIALIVLSACQDNPDGKANRIYPESNGNINTLQIVMSNDLWEGRVGEAVRGVFAAPVYGLPQDEPLFNMNQIPPNAFSGFAQRNRTFVKFTKSDSSYVRYSKNPYAKPQLAVFIGGPTKEDLIAQLNDKSDEIISALKSTEIVEKQRRISKSLLNEHTPMGKCSIVLRW